MPDTDADPRRSRNLASIIWVHISFERNGTADRPLPKDWRLRAFIEKKTMVNLVQGFSVAVKVSSGAVSCNVLDCLDDSSYSTMCGSNNACKN